MLTTSITAFCWFFTTVFNSGLTQFWQRAEHFGTTHPAASAYCHRDSVKPQPVITASASVIEWDISLGGIMCHVCTTPPSMLRLVEPAGCVCLPAAEWDSQTQETTQVPQNAAGWTNQVTQQTRAPGPPGFPHVCSIQGANMDSLKLKAALVR